MNLRTETTKPDTHRQTELDRWTCNIRQTRPTPPSTTTMTPDTAIDHHLWDNPCGSGIFC